MSLVIDGKEYYSTAESCRMAGISKNTFLRWVRSGLFADVGHRDRRGWRLFTEEDVERLKIEANKIYEVKTTQLDVIRTHSQGLRT